jgi:sugar phosphate isomerase/epimerase
MSAQCRVQILLIQFELLQRNSQVKSSAPHSHLKMERFAAAILVGLLLFGVSYLADWILFRMGIAGAQTIVDNLVIGVIAALAAYLWARYEAERQARARERMILLIELNHHIRNALTVLGHGATLENGPDKLRLIDEAVDRVDRVLTELVPTAGERSVPRLYLEDPQPNLRDSRAKS